MVTGVAGLGLTFIELGGRYVSRYYFANCVNTYPNRLNSRVALQPQLGIRPKWRPGIDCSDFNHTALAWLHLAARKQCA